MWEIIVGIPLFLFAGLFQVSFLGRITLLNGTPDILMLFMIVWSINDRTEYSWIFVILCGLIMSYISAMPMNGYLWMYLIIWGIIRFIKTKVWEMPLIIMLFMTIIGTVIIAFGTLGLLFLQNASVNYTDAFKLIITPNLVLNLLFSIPIYAFLNDVVNTIYIGEEGE